MLLEINKKGRDRGHHYGDNGCGHVRCFGGQDSKQEDVEMTDVSEEVIMLDELDPHVIEFESQTALVDELKVFQ